MSDKTGIEWCDATWNPVTGCTKVSGGCRNCYALTFAERWRGTVGHYFENGFDLTLRPDKLDQPLKWTKPRKIFVNSMSDLFHEKVPNYFITQVFAIMANAEQHTFQILTKRPERMYKLLSDDRFWLNVRICAVQGINGLKFGVPHARLETPLPNVWLGVSVEDQKAADERIPLLLQTPAAIRFLSCEPLLGPVNLEKYMWPLYWSWDGKYNTPQEAIAAGAYAERKRQGLISANRALIDWVIVGGESGHGARPMHPEWARSLRDQCQAAGTSFFFKQWGQHIPYSQSPEGFEMSGEQRAECDSYPHGESFIKGNKKINGRLLDGLEWSEFPQ